MILEERVNVSELPPAGLLLPESRPEFAERRAEGKQQSEDLFLVQSPEPIWPRIFPGL